MFFIGAMSHYAFASVSIGFILFTGRPAEEFWDWVAPVCCILANTSAQLGRSLTWDAAKEVVKGDETANKLLRRPYRKPWVHPEV